MTLILIFKKLQKSANSEEEEKQNKGRSVKKSRQ